MSDMVLHGYWRSTAAYRVRIALNLKQVDYVQITHDLRKGAQRDPAYRAVAPHGLVPTVEFDGKQIVESPAILEWLEEGWPNPPLLPHGREERAIVRSMAALIGCDVHPLNNLRVLQALRSEFGADSDQIQTWMARWMKEGFEGLETLVGKHGGQFCFADRPGLADVYLVPQLYSAERFEVDLTAFPRLRRAGDAARKLPAFAEAHPSVQPDADVPE